MGHNRSRSLRTTPKLADESLRQIEEVARRAEREQRTRTKWRRLAFPKCGQSVAVSVTATAWCTRCVGEPEMLEIAT